MPVRTNTALSTELRDHMVAIRAMAREYGLDFFEVVFEVLDFDTMNRIAAYGGFPVRYPHWRWGMEYEKLSRRDAYGMGRIYEMVINNDPSYAYLQESNSVTDQKLVMAHVYAHSDFFKRNAWFSKTNRGMMDQMANHATRVRRHIERQGLERVEQFIDLCLSVEHLIDAHSMFVKRPGRDEEVSPSEHHAAGARPDPFAADRYPAKSYMDPFINPRQTLKDERKRLLEEAQEKKSKFPSEPDRDVLLFLLDHAPMEPWQVDVLSIIRDEAYYYAPQGMTKVMNEGWATYWHSKMMTSHFLKASEIIDYAQQHSGVVAMEPGGFNPYKIGVEMFKDIERRWDTGQHGAQWSSLDKIGQKNKFDDHSMKGRSKIFEVRSIYNDVTFIEEFLTEEFAYEHKLFVTHTDPSTGQQRIASRDFTQIKQTLLYRLSNMGQPILTVVDGNYLNRGELYLAHQWNGLDIEIASAVEVLKNLRLLWGRPVHLQARIDDEMCLFSCNDPEEQPTREKITDETQSPAHDL